MFSQYNAEGGEEITSLNRTQFSSGAFSAALDCIFVKGSKAVLLYIEYICGYGVHAYNSTKGLFVVCYFFLIHKHSRDAN